ncbi:hypothetical protein G7Y31_09690 [Corynebacterium lizhenjunii]|uniref:Uncharacterized protein n=1 Tax=Corynebacterium lizhenjunii TaxID=2709394 RepID=A0A7T0KF42_9CORY|nr:hypothetical protein [Corynebacterium lizhenjunii]QPK78799.1 hypothetical protein G7Y31_09690 [Corynebacterium lizhenjunii]
MLAALGVTYHLNRVNAHSMLMAPSGRNRVVVRYAYLAAASVLGIMASFLLGVVLLLLIAVTQNSWNSVFALSSAIDATGFIFGATAVGVVVASVLDRVPVIVRLVVAGGLCLLVGMYSVTFEYLWGLGILRTLTEAPAKLWAVGATLVLALCAVIGAVIFASGKSDPFTPVASLAFAPFVAAAAGLGLGVATGSLPVAPVTVVCDGTDNPNITVCVSQAQEAALQPSLDAVNRALAVLGDNAGQEQVVYTPFFGSTQGKGTELLYAPWDHHSSLDAHMVGSVVDTAACDSEARPESAAINSALQSYLRAQAGVIMNAGPVRDATGRIATNPNAEGESSQPSANPFEELPLEFINAVIAQHRQEIAECTAQWEWFGVNPQ